jgi:hypothetical protein
MTSSPRDTLPARWYLDAPFPHPDHPPHRAMRPPLQPSTNILLEHPLSLDLSHSSSYEGMVVSLLPNQPLTPWQTGERTRQMAETYSNRVWSRGRGVNRRVRRIQGSKPVDLVMKLRFLLIFTFSYAVVQTGHADGAQGESTVPSVVGYPFTWKCRINKVLSNLSVSCSLQSRVYPSTPPLCSLITSLHTHRCPHLTGQRTLTP